MVANVDHKLLQKWNSSASFSGSKNPASIKMGAWWSYDGAGLCSTVWDSYNLGESFIYVYNSYWEIWKWWASKTVY